MNIQPTRLMNNDQKIMDFEKKLRWNLWMGFYFNSFSFIKKEKFYYNKIK